MATVALYRPESFDLPPVERPSRPSDGLDINELCRRLESYRLETKMEQVRQRSKRLQDKRSSTMTYQPRYASRLSLHSSDMLRPATSCAGDKSRRQSRYMTSGDEKSDRSDKSDEDDRVDSGRSSQWLNPKQLLAAREKGLSEAETAYRLRAERTKEDEEYAAARKRSARRSFLSPGPTPDRHASTASRRRESSVSPPPVIPEGKEKKNRPLTTAFENLTMPDLRSLVVPPVPRNPYAGQEDGAEPTKEKKKKKNFLPPARDRNDWSQKSQSCAVDDADRASFMAKLNRRRSRFVPIVVPAEQTGSSSSIIGGDRSAAVVVVEGGELRTRPTGKVAAAEERARDRRRLEQKGEKRRPGLLTSWSADSALDVRRGREAKEAERNQDKSTPKRRKSLFDLFRRRKE
ncbi:Histone-lysine N-methyltransferase set9 [Sphaceloma murrayae]|uniref:Histone-lysine N-methyltransferase set9 n=1 Tax=Sphaceloma murrayae TaxID=2082308 RepID=A0A2K1QNK5_9PEZI|nr:Histone-lysine N-methyltransferase set9 [Sphaceloma murrayae]